MWSVSALALWMWAGKRVDHETALGTGACSLLAGLMASNFGLNSLICPPMADD